MWPSSTMVPKRSKLLAGSEKSTAELCKFLLPNSQLKCSHRGETNLSSTVAIKFDRKQESFHSYRFPFSSRHLFQFFPLYLSFPALPGSLSLRILLERFLWLFEERRGTNPLYLLGFPSKLKIAQSNRSYSPFR